MSIGQRSLSDYYSLMYIYITSNTMQTTTVTTSEPTKIATPNVNQTNTSHVDQQKIQSNKQVVTDFQKKNE